MYWCFHCYGINAEPSGPCAHCGAEIAAPPEATYEERLIWALGHPDGDRATLAARTLGELGATAAVPRLRELAAGGADPFLAVAALRSLIRLESVEALRPLLGELAERGPFMVARIARDALGGSPEGPAAPVN